MLHILLHFTIPLLVLLFLKKKTHKQKLNIYLILIATMIVDVDHLLATPIYDPQRCSMGFHPLHTAIPLVIYLLFLGFKTTRFVGIGLLIHMALDSFDCYQNLGIWYT